MNNFYNLKSILELIKSLDTNFPTNLSSYLAILKITDLRRCDGVLKLNYRNNPKLIHLSKFG